MLSGDSVAGETDSVLGESVPGGSVLDGVVLPIADSELARIVVTIEKALAELQARDTVAVTNADRRALLTRMETVSRSLFGFSHTWIADLLVQHGLDGIDGSIPDALGVLMRISRVRASQRIRYAEEFGKRNAVTGERLAPVRPETAAAAEDGDLDEEHQNVIRLFFWRLRDKVDAETKERAERQLAQGARDLPPDQFKELADRLYAHLDPDGDLPPEQVADQTYVRFGHQDEHGLSKMNGKVDAELRAYMEAVFSKFAKPGKCNPADDKPDVDDPDDETDVDSGDGTSGDDTEQDEPTLFDQPDDDPGDPDDPGDVGDAGTGEGRSAADDSDDSGDSGDDNGDDDGRPDDDDDGRPDDGDEGPDDGDGGPGGGSSGGGSNGGGPGGHGGSGGDGADTSESAAASKTQTQLDAELRAARDHRGQGRRQHDALKVMLRQMLASGKLGQHRGLPVTAVITMTLKDLEAGTGHAFTATGSTVKMRDAIRMASHAHHYLVIFDDDGRPLHLGRTKRIASENQRIVLMAADRGCTFPGCTRPATWSQVHHIDEWVNGGNTDIETLTFGCDRHHRLVGPNDTQWATTKAEPDHQYPGRTLWHAPSTVDPSRKGRINHYHHPDEYLDPENSGAPPI